VALVVGLGNPGATYAETRHNVGFWVLERLVARWRATEGERRSEYRSWNARVGDADVALLEPRTFMNRSGDAVVAWREAHGLESTELLVAADDVYLPVGHLRLRASGSSGGHRGLESVEQSLGTRDYVRLRIGVGAVAAAELKEHVLEVPSALELEALGEAADAAAGAVESWLVDGIIVAMNRINRKVSKEVSES